MFFAVEFNLHALLSSRVNKIFIVNLGFLMNYEGEHF
jgi:hypothetical protein